MWETKYFKTEEEAQKFMIKKSFVKYQMSLIFVQNGYGVEYKALKRILS